MWHFPSGPSGRNIQYYYNVKKLHQCLILVQEIKIQESNSKPYISLVVQQFGWPAGYSMSKDLDTSPLILNFIIRYCACQIKMLTPCSLLQLIKKFKYSLQHNLASLPLHLGSATRYQSLFKTLYGHLTIKTKVIMSTTQCSVVIQQNVATFFCSPFKKTKEKWHINSCHWHQ